MSTVLNLISAILMCIVVYKVSFTNFNENTIIVLLLFCIILGILNVIFSYKRLSK